MAALTIGWEYLTGYAVATDPSSRERAEWPPHPARVFMALAAAWFETDPGEGGSDEDRHEHAAEGEALRWLQGLGDPELWLPPVGKGGERSHVTVFVPVNDKAGPSPASLQSAPAVTRSKQARSFPRRHVGYSPVFMRWTEAGGLDEHRVALARLSAKVTRIGHSSSLVWMWVAANDAEPEKAKLERWCPSEGTGAMHCRRVSRGLLDELPEQTNILRIEAFAEQVTKIEDAQREAYEAKASADAARRKSANRALKDSKQWYEEQFGEKYTKSAVPPPRLRPHIGLWTGYRRADPSPEPESLHSHFDTDLLILAHESGPRLPVVASLAVCAALRGAVMRHCPDPVPEWVSGHKSDGSPSENESGHMAVLPLPFVGHEHADGHLLGLAMAFPRNLDRKERGRALGPLIVKETGEPKAVELRLGRLGMWTLHLSDWDETRRSLAPETWTASPEGSCVWASVTPIVLDRFPKADRMKDRLEWEQEVGELLAGACKRIGLPSPLHIDIDTTCWHHSSPRALCKRRRLRNGGAGDTGYGEGFPAYLSKGTGGSARPQVHAWIEFSEPVVGPLLLGAGRYRGYGVCKPIGQRRGGRQ